MKRFFAVISALAILLSLFACGGKTTDDQNDGSTDGSSDSLSSDPSDIDSHTADHLKYEDLPRTETFVIWSEDDHPCIEIDYPDVRFDTHGNGMGSENSLDYSIVTVNAEQRMPDTSLDDAFMTLLNGEDGFHSVLKMVNRSSYADITPEKETVTPSPAAEKRSDFREYSRPTTTEPSPTAPSSATAHSATTSR